MPSVDELAADDPYDVEAATRAAKKMTSNQLRELIKIRDFVPPRDGEAPKFWVGDINTWDGNWSGRGQRTRFVNPEEFAETLKRAVPERTSLYTGNEGMESGYIYTSAVIKLGESGISDY